MISRDKQNEIKFQETKQKYNKNENESRFRYQNLFMKELSSGNDCKRDKIGLSE